MPNPVVESFLASLKRCLVTPDFLRSFYERFMDSSEEVAEKFAHPDFPRQTRVLADSLYVMAVVAAAGLDHRTLTGRSLYLPGRG